VERTFSPFFLEFLKAVALITLLATAGCQVGTPGTVQTAIIQGAKRHLTVRGRDQTNPLSPTPDNVRAGREKFTAYCMVCHGLDGQNSGVPFAEKMDPPIPDLSSASVQAYTDGQLHWIIQNGISPSGMPASRGIFHDEEIWQIVLYIRHLPPKGSMGEPQVYGGSGLPQPQR
jgi:mono/diheme cytochrome c family protein